MPPRRIDLQEQQRFAEDRYAKYSRTARSLLQDADGESHRGNWSEAANKLHAALESVAAAAGVCRELNLIYILRED
jgi:hypothetical protein